MKALLLALLLSGCVVRERVRVEYKTLPAKVIQKIILVVPEAALPKPPPPEPEWKKRENLA